MFKTKEDQKVMKANFNISNDIDWANDIESVLSQIEKEFNKICDKTKFKIERNRTLDGKPKEEKNLNIYEEGVASRVGYIYLVKRQQLMHLSFTTDYVNKLKNKIPELNDVDVKEGRKMNYRSFKNVGYKKAVEIMCAFAEM